jgi:hypothetical protein
MSKFDVLTKYISMIQLDSIDEWIIDKENDGTPEHPIQMLLLIIHGWWILSMDATSSSHRT